MKPGAMPPTRMPWGASSRASYLLIMTTAAFAALSLKLPTAAIEP
jgi:hypothetical protein